MYRVGNARHGDILFAEVKQLNPSHDPGNQLIAL
jgi:hypothetical protein